MQQWGRCGEIAMARVVNTDTTLGRRATIQTLGLMALYLTALVLVVNLGRGVVREMGGVDNIRAVGLAKATCHHTPSASSRCWGSIWAGW